MSDGNAMTKDDGNAMLLVNKRGATTVNVGGTRFQTAASTLMTNSTYFASLFSDNWLNSSHAKEDDDEIFLDQDPIVFAKLLSYMRKGYGLKILTWMFYSLPSSYEWNGYF